MTALQCPGCGHIHTASDHGAGRTFRCGGCRRLLSVPVAVSAAATATGGDTSDDSFPLFTGRQAAPERPRPNPPARGPAPSPAPRPAAGGVDDPWGDDTGDSTGPGDAFATRAGALRAPAPEREGGPTPGAERRSKRVPVWTRALVWALALAFGLALTAVALRAVGVLDVDAVINAYAERGFRRYAALLILVPVWAGLSSTLAHLTLEHLARRRRR